MPPDLRGGYDYWLAANHLEFVSDAYDARLFDGDGNEQKLPGYRVDAQTDAAIRFCEIIFGYDYAALMRRAADNALTAERKPAKDE